MSQRLLCSLGFFCLALSMATIGAQAQYGSLPLGTLAVSGSTPCPGSGWYNYQGTYVACYVAAITNCAGASPLGVTFGYLDPVGYVKGVLVEKGVIVLHTGQGGTSPAGDDVGVPDGDFSFANYYFLQGYVVVQLAWDSDWEATQDPFPLTNPPTYGNVQQAACRPATFFNYVFNNIYVPILGTNSSAGMCGHGFSAGSAALAYSMAYYKPAPNTQWWWDNVEMLAGPAVSDMNQGCEKPVAEPIAVCPPGQWGCPAGNNSWQGGPTFVPTAAGWVGKWTNDNTCANPSLNQTSLASDQRWLQQSIVDDGTNNPVFTYPHTAMAGWLCRTLGNQQQQSCITNYHWNTCPNESSQQGQIFFQNFTQSNSPASFNLYPVDNCNGPEGVLAGTVAALQGVTGLQGVEYDMAGGGPHNQSPQCVHPH
jgi:hypothetical protein